MADITQSARNMMNEEQLHYALRDFVFCDFGTMMFLTTRMLC